MIRFEQVSYTYPSGYEALKALSCEINAGEYVSIVGKAGSGKTTFFMLLVGLLRISKGDLFVLDQSLKKTNDKQLSTLRRKIGTAARWLPLVNHVSALENIIQPLLISGMKPLLAEKKGKQLLSELELGHRYRDDVVTFSDSEYSKLLFARAIVHDPLLILIDDPFDQIDSPTYQLINQMLEERVAQGVTVIDSSRESTTNQNRKHRTIKLMDSQITDDREQLFFDISI
ncbi:MAG: ATP-binding cassette domain-containing protein [Betaproteobacteria bacterium]|nr:ATP-binding cassette domain-containing protein [Betaproteobacteria bacterium]